MPWKYTLSSRHAIHLETGEKFHITYVNNTVKTSQDIELVPSAESARRWSEIELDRLREELWAVMREEFEQASLRSKLSALIKNPLLGDNYQAADVISRISGKNVSQRSIQAWLIESDKRSSRKCPSWAVSALETYLAEPENQKRLRDLVNYYKTTAAPAAAPPAETHGEPVAAIAQQALAIGDRRLDEWRRAPLAELPEMLFDLEQRINGYLEYFSQAINAITSTVLEEDKDLNEIRRSLRDKLDELRHVDFMRRGSAAAFKHDGDNLG